MLLNGRVITGRTKKEELYWIECFLVGVVIWSWVEHGYGINVSSALIAFSLLLKISDSHESSIFRSDQNIFLRHQM